MKAYEERQAKGLDPGFFLQPTTSTVKVVLDNESYEKRRFAALQAQEEYERALRENGSQNDSMEIELEPPAQKRND